MNRRRFENLIHRKLISLGWLVQRVHPSPGGWLPDRAYWEPGYIQRLGFQPATLIDVGVAGGTPELYAAFPNAYLLLIEPLQEFSTEIASILATRAGVHFPVACGGEPGEREIRIEPRNALRSSFYTRHPLEKSGDAPILRRAPVDTLDRLIASVSCPRPFGLKIDAEGAELDILRGAASTLADTEFVIAEVSVLSRFDGSYRFASFIAELDSLGFEVCDILGIGRADSSRVTFFDLVFERKRTLPGT
jgi:FkbM family methyltransferase